jgi:hypothetical protein
MNIDAKTSDLIDLLGFAPDSLSALAVKTALLRVRNETLEQAAKIADERASELFGQPEPFNRDEAIFVSEARDIATAIRALKE